MICFSVPGIPVGQGSKVYVPTARGPRGRESNEKTLVPWRMSVAAAGAAAVAPDGPYLGPVRVAVDFVFPRPKSHYRTGAYATWLKESAPTWHSQQPDLDKLERAIGDALKGVVVRDDAQIASWHVTKSYGREPRADITIEPLLASTPLPTMAVVRELEMVRAELASALLDLEERDAELALLRGAA